MKHDPNHFVEDDILYRKYGGGNKAVDDFEEFLDADLPSKIFPKDDELKEVMGDNWYREDPFLNKEEVRKYIKDHFRLFRIALKEEKNEQKSGI